MSPSDEEFGDSIDPERDELWNYVPMTQRLKKDPIPPSSQRGQAAYRPAPEFDQPPWKRSRNSDESPQSTSPESTQVPWKRSQGRKTFGDDAIVRSSNMHGLTPVRLSEPPAPRPGMTYRTVIKLAGVAMAAGILGHILPSGSLIPLLQPTPPSRQFDQPEISEKTVEQLNVGAAGQQQQLDKPAQLPVSAPDTAVINNDAPALRDAPPTKSEVRRLDANAIMLMVKNGIGHLANGNIIAARMMLKPAAEVGDPIAAFEFAQTYDPLVLTKLKIEGGIEIKADVGLALTWYRKAKDLGSAIAEERLDSLAHVSE